MKIDCYLAEYSYVLTQLWKLQLRVKLKPRSYRTWDFLRITNYSEHEWIWTADFWHVTKVTYTIRHLWIEQLVLTGKKLEVQTLLWSLDIMILNKSQARHLPKKLSIFSMMKYTCFHLKVTSTTKLFFAIKWPLMCN